MDQQVVRVWNDLTPVDKGDILTGKLAFGEYPCNTNDDCLGNLQCFIREDDEKVSGLTQNVPTGKNVCIYP